MNYFSRKTNFYGKVTPEILLETYGSPLYVYNEEVLRKRCRNMAGILPGLPFKPNYSIKANSNLRLLQIIREEGFSADAMSPGEIYVLLRAGFKPEDIFYVSNNVSEEEMKFAIDRNILTSVDSISQLKMYGKLNPGGNVAIRFNPGVGAGHHEKVITGGKNTKFGVNPEAIPEVKDILKECQLTLVGINQHIGSLFMDGHLFVESVKSILNIALQFEKLQFIDMGGGFGIPYKKQEGQEELDIRAMSEELVAMLQEWRASKGIEVKFKTEPGRYVVAESGILLGRVYAIKNNDGKKYVGTDLGFQTLKRPVMYDSHHDVEIYRKGKLLTEGPTEKVDLVGNICETGDILAKDREMFKIEEGDIVGIMDAGAYGFSMSCNYNNRLRPAEVLIKSDGTPELIRKRETLEDLLRNFT